MSLKKAIRLIKSQGVIGINESIVKRNIKTINMSMWFADADVDNFFIVEKFSRGYRILLNTFNGILIIE